MTLRLQEARLPGPAQLQQWRLELGTEEDKCLVLYALLKLGLLRGRALLFAGALERGYRLRLFLEQLGLPAGLLNAQLPARSRYFPGGAGVGGHLGGRFWWDREQVRGSGVGCGALGWGPCLKQSKGI